MGIARRAWGRLRGERDAEPQDRPILLQLDWEMADTRPLTAAEVTLTVVEAPSVPRRYSWSLQVGFADDNGARLGTARLGLHWHPDAPRSRAASWAGLDGSGHELTGTPLGWPDSVGEDGLCDFPWETGSPWVLRISRSPDRPASWRGEIVDPESGVTTVVRDLDGGGTHLVDLSVITDAVASCEHPGVRVRWTGFAAATPDGATTAPVAVRTGYGRRTGCDNTTALYDGDGLVQVTNTVRRLPAGARLALRPEPGGPVTT